MRRPRRTRDVHRRRRRSIGRGTGHQLLDGGPGGVPSGGVEDAAALGAPARERFARLVEGAEGETMTDARRLFVYAQLRAQGEDSTANRAAGLDGRVPLEHLPALMRALGHYPSERELNDAMTELKVEAENRGESRRRRLISIVSSRCSPTADPRRARGSRPSRRRSRRWARVETRPSIARRSFERSRRAARR